MPLVTTIRWRKWPDEKPQREGWYTVRYDDGGNGHDVTSMGFYAGKWVESEDARPIKDRFDHSDWVAHFALPTDIITEETP